MAYSEVLWKEAKKKCRLNNEDIKIAKELGINPKSLIKNMPNKNEQWKAPVSIWLREMQEKRQKKSLQKQKRREVTKLCDTVNNVIRTDKELEEANEEF